MYIEDREGGMQVNLHVDQRAATYGDGSAHGGEYSGPLVEREMARIGQFIESHKHAPAPTPQPKKQEKKNLEDYL